MTKLSDKIMRSRRFPAIRLRRCYICHTPENDENPMRKKRFCKDCAEDFRGIIDSRTGKINMKKVRQIAKKRRANIKNIRDVLIDEL